MIIIKNDILSVKINTLGAELQSIKDAKGIEYLWQGNDLYWKGKATNIFPFVGRLEESRYMDGETSYTIGNHGFARNSEFIVGEYSEHKVELILKSNEETMKQYPYNFIFTITYELMDDKIDITFKLENKSENKMYFALGGHPGFNIPITKNSEFEDYYLEFIEPCTPVRVGVSKRCFIDGNTLNYPLEEGKLLNLNHNLYEDDAIILKDTSKVISIKNNVNEPEIEVGFPNMKYLASWKVPDEKASYLCIEPWTTLPGREKVIETLSKFPDMNVLNSNEIHENKWWIRIRN